MTKAHVGWDEARTEMVRKLWAEGLSASHIANRLGGVTRNGVIGKVHRMGLCQTRDHKRGFPTSGGRSGRSSRTSASGVLKLP